MRKRTISIFYRIILGLLGLVVIYYAVLFIERAVMYARFDTREGFLVAKQAYIDHLYYKIPFYVHVFTSAIILPAGLLQFSRTMLHHYKSWHRIAGGIYIFLVLCFTAPSGFVMGFYANGFVPGKVSFVFQATLWWLYTLGAFYYLRKQKYQYHGAFMVRSYALALGAVTLRVLSFIFYEYLDVGRINTYVTVSWLSWTLNLVLAEAIIHFGIVDRIFRKPKKIF